MNSDIIATGCGDYPNSRTNAHKVRSGPLKTLNCSKVNTLLFLRAINGSNGYSNFSLFNNAGDIYFHLSFRWEEGAAFANTRIDGSWGKETPILKRLRGEASVVLDLSGTSEPTLVVASKWRKRRIGGFPELENLKDNHPYSGEFNGDFEFAAFLDRRDFDVIALHKAPHNLAVSRIANRDRLIERKISRGAATSDDKRLYEMIEAAISAGAMPRVEKISLAIDALPFAADLFRRNAIAPSVEVFAGRAVEPRSALALNWLSTAGITAKRRSEFKRVAASADILAGVNICAEVPVGLEGARIFSLENGPLPSAELQSRLKSGQVLYIASRESGRMLHVPTSPDSDGMVAMPKPHSAPPEIPSNSPEISCVIIGVNDLTLLRRSLDSVLTQTNGSFELIVVVDGADSEAWAMLGGLGDPRIKPVLKTVDGPTSALKQGVSAATGDILCFLDAGDTRAPEVFAAAVTAFRRHGCEVMFTTGHLRDRHLDSIPFRDEQVFTGICELQPEVACTPDSDSTLLEQLVLIAADPRNRFIKREFLTKSCLELPSGCEWDDLRFHALLIASAKNILVSNARTFTHFENGEPEQGIPKQRSEIDALAIATDTLMSDENSDMFHVGSARTLLLLVISRQVERRSHSLSPECQKKSVEDWEKLLNAVSGLYFSQLFSEPITSYLSKHEWMVAARQFILGSKT